MRDLDRLCDAYIDLLWHLDPAAASAAGSVSGDGRLGRFDAEAIREHLAALRATTSALEELEVEALADEIDRTALLDDVRATIARLDEERPQVRDPGFWVTHIAGALGSLLLRPEDAGAPGHRAHAAAERITAIPQFLESARGTLARPPLVLVDGALAALGPLGELLVQAAAEFGAEAPGGPAALNPVVAAALEALTRFGHRLRTEIEPDPDVGGAALGEARFDRRLHHRHAIRAGAGELWRYATRLLEETEAALVVRAAGLDPTRSWRDLLAGLGTDATDAVAAVRDELERAHSFLRERGVAGSSAVGPEVHAQPAWLRGVLPEVAYLPAPVPPAAGTARLLVAPGRRSRFAVPTIVAAEALPGRHLQEGAARGLGTEVRRRLRAPISVEGWALYAEQLMEELGFFAAPETRLVRLARLLQAGGRLAVDVGLHARGLSAREALALFTDRVGLGRAEAEAEVRRIVAQPTDGAAAALGRREILGLRDAAGVGAGDPAALERFHAALLGFGAVPPGLAGWGLGIER